MKYINQKMAALLFFHKCHRGSSIFLCIFIYSEEVEAYVYGKNFVLCMLF